jgi:adenylosuccinate synthase
MGAIFLCKKRIITKTLFNFAAIKINYMIRSADVIVDLQAGDTGKGKVAHHLLSKNPNYTHVIRYNGGGNAGHTIYHNGKKIVTHFIPCGVMYGKKSIIGPGCVVNPDKLFNEIATLEESGIDVVSNLMIDKRVHIITDEHLLEDGLDTKIGTTKQGIGPVYRDKYGRTGRRAENEESIRQFVYDIYDLHIDGENEILFEGAQGFELDVDWGDYPFVTSSHCTVGSAILNGVPPQKIRNVYGVAKVYRTYVGAKVFEEPSDVFDKIRELGNEYGATTGRKRQIAWLDLNMLIKAININGVNILVFNKADILEQIDLYRFIVNNEIIEPKNISDFELFVKYYITIKCPSIEDVYFSKTPYAI